MPLSWDKRELRSTRTIALVLFNPIELWYITDKGLPLTGLVDPSFASALEFPIVVETYAWLESGSLFFRSLLTALLLWTRGGEIPQEGSTYSWFDIEATHLTHPAT